MTTPAQQLLIELCTLTHLPAVDFEHIDHYAVQLNQNFHITFLLLSEEKLLISGELFSLELSDLDWDLPYELLQANLNLATSQGPWIAYSAEKKLFTLLMTVEASKTSAAELKSAAEFLAQQQFVMNEKIKLWRQKQKEKDSAEKKLKSSKMFFHPA